MLAEHMVREPVQCDHVLFALDQRQALRQHPVKACWFMTTFQNPTGASVPEDEPAAREDAAASCGPEQSPLRRLTKMGEEEIAAKVAERLKAVSLPGFEERLPAGLSGGQKKRVGVARATVTQAPIVLYDEPAAGLDPVTSQKIFDLLRKEQRESGATVVMVSSDIDRLLTVTDRVGMLYRGKLIFDGTTAEAKASRDPFVRQFVDGKPDGPVGFHLPARPIAEPSASSSATPSESRIGRER